MCQIMFGIMYGKHLIFAISVGDVLYFSGDIYGFMFDFEFIACGHKFDACCIVVATLPSDGQKECVNHYLNAFHDGIFLNGLIFDENIIKGFIVDKVFCEKIDQVF